MADINELSDYHVLLIIEWDGKKPSGTWYDFLHKHKIFTRVGSKEEYPSALNRRHKASMGYNPAAVCFTEGIYLCRNDDVANMVGNEAKRLGAQSVVVGQTYIRNMNIPEEDMQVYEEMRIRNSKRGRKPVSEAGVYTVTCHSEALTIEVTAESLPDLCSSCGRHRIHSYLGRRPTFVVSPEDWESPYDLWLRSRFDDGQFRIPYFTTTAHGIQLPTSPPLGNIPMPKIVLPDDFPSDDPEVMLRVWDAVFCLSKLLGDDYRRKERLNVFGAYLNSENPDPRRWSMARPARHYDLLDVCIVAEEFKEYL